MTSTHIHLWRLLRQDLRRCVQEAPPARRGRVMVKRLCKYAIAGLLYSAGLTGLLLRRVLESSRSSLILGFHGTTDGPVGDFSRGHSISNVRAQLRFLKRYLRQASLEEIVEAIVRGDSPPCATFAVTFDDGLANNVIHAIPVLKDLGLPATFFLPSSLVGSPLDLWFAVLGELIRNWPGAAIPAEPGLWPVLPVVDEMSGYAAYFRIKEALKNQDGRRQEILERLTEAAGGHFRPPEEDRVVGPDLVLRMSQPPFKVGAHSRTHPILSALDSESARSEIDGSRKDLERLLGEPVLDFAYPNGRFSDFNETSCRLVVQAGYRCALTTEPGAVRRGDDRVALRRCMPENVPAFLAAFDLLYRVWADRHRSGDLGRPLEERVSYLGTRPSRSAS